MSWIITMASLIALVNKNKEYIELSDDYNDLLGNKIELIKKLRRLNR